LPAASALRNSAGIAGAPPAILPAFPHAPMKKYHVALVGYGWAGGAHLEAINATSLAQVPAVVSSRPLDPAALNARHGGSIRTYTSLDEALACPDLHAVSICSYPHLHAAHAIAAARAGKHIILEKPIILSLADAMKSHRACLAADLSARENRPVALAELNG